MLFEKSELRSDEWEFITTEELITSCTNEEIDMMINVRATIRKSMVKYRRYIPDYIKDWAKPGTTYA